MAGLLARARAVALVGALGSLAVPLPSVVTAGAGPLGVRVAVVLVAGLLAAHWVRCTRRGAFPTWAEPLELLAVLAVLAVGPGDPGLPLFVVLLRSLFGPWWLSVVRTSALFAGVTAVLLLTPKGVELAVADRALGLALSTGVMSFLHLMLQRFDRVERRLHSIVEGSSDVVSIVGADGRLLWQGGSIRRLLGHAPEGLVGTAFVGLVHPRDGEAVAEQLAATAAGHGVSRAFSARLRHADGGYRWMEAVATNLTHDRHVDGILLNLRDTTDRRRLEGERKALARQRSADEARRVELERMRERIEAQRERQSLEERLLRSQRLESVGLLAGGVAHDFNNLLAIILNYAGFVRAELPPGGDAQADLREIEHAAQRGAALTRQLLLFAQRKVHDPEVLDVDEVVGELVQMLDRSLGRQVELLHERGPVPVRVEADRASLEQLVMNLVLNARDAIEGSGTVRIRTRPTALSARAAEAHGIAAGDYLALTVTDPGCGMDEATLARAMEPFFTTKDVGTGTGLGMATVFGIVSQAGGAVRLSSEVGVGTSVQVLLPATDQAPRAAEADQHAQDAQVKVRVLVVDDEEPVRTLVARVLRSAGHRAVLAGSGDEALALLDGDEDGFGLLLTDLMMPGMTGLDLARRVRARAPSQPVLFMSGYSKELLDGGAGGLGGVLPKPFTAGELRAAVVAAARPATAPAG